MTFCDPVKSEVWRVVRALNDAWAKGDPDDLFAYFHSDMVAITASDRLRLVGRDACLASWKNIAQTAKSFGWKEIDPLINIFGETAVVTYYFEMSFDMNGRRIDLGGRDMFDFVRERGKWVAVADQFSAYPT